MSTDSKKSFVKSVKELNKEESKTDSASLQSNVSKRLIIEKEGEKQSLKVIPGTQPKSIPPPSLDKLININQGILAAHLQKNPLKDESKSGNLEESKSNIPQEASQNSSAMQGFQRIKAVYVSETGNSYLVDWILVGAKFEPTLTEINNKEKQTTDDYNYICSGTEYTYKPQESFVNESEATRNANKMLRGDPLIEKEHKKTRRGKKSHERKQKDLQNKHKNMFCLKCREVAEVEILKFRCQCRVRRDGKTPPCARIHVACILGEEYQCHDCNDIVPKPKKGSM